MDKWRWEHKRSGGGEMVEESTETTGGGAYQGQVKTWNSPRNLQG